MASTRTGTALLSAGSILSRDLDLLFVYGILRTDGAAPLASVIRQKCESLGTATVPAKLYDLGSYPGAVLSRNPRDRVVGEVFRLPSPQAAFRILDPFEGSEYRRSPVEAELRDASRVRAWIYLLAQTDKPRTPVTVGDWIQHKADPTDV